MSEFVALLWREHQEHRGAFFWAPVVILALILIAGAAAVPRVADLRIDVSAEHTVDESGQVSERQTWHASGADEDVEDEFGRRTAMGVLGLDVAGRTDKELRERIQPALRAVALPFYWVLIIVSLFACIACLHDERKDRSVLFWKSMPVSDTHTVLSKYVYLAWLAPLATLLAIVLAQVFGLAMLSILVEEGMAGRVWGNSGLLTQSIQLIFGFLLNGLNLLPIFGWFMFASAWFNSIPFVWALGIPFWLGVFEAIIFNSGVIKSIVSFHGKMPSLPRPGADEAPVVGLGFDGLGDQLWLLSQGQFWFGLVLGVALIAGAIYVRGRKNEI